MARRAMRRCVTGLTGVLIGCSACLALGQRPADEDSPAPRKEGASGAAATAVGQLTFEESAPGRVLFQLRPRYSYVSQSNKDGVAQAANIRVLLGYRSRPIDDFEFVGQVVNVTWREPKRATLEPRSFGSKYPLVADPDKSDINLLYADYLGASDLRIRAGRQAIRLDNERFVGKVDVRQMPQVFDAVSLRYTGMQDAQIYAAHAWHVRSHFGTRMRTNTTLLNASVQTEIGSSLGAYAYFQDQPKINIDTGFEDNSNRILGARIEGNTPSMNGISWYYTAEAARQRPYANGDRRIHANYQRLAFGPSWRAYSAQLNYERLGSNGGRYGFQMPLSYNTFQGWSYSFYSTPAEGVRDLNASFSAALGRLDVTLKRHRFRADTGSGALGSEWDLAIGYRINRSLSIRAVFARFRADPAALRPTGPRSVFGQVPAPSANRHYVTLRYDY